MSGRPLSDLTVTMSCSFQVRKTLRASPKDLATFSGTSNAARASTRAMGSAGRYRCSSSSRISARVPPRFAPT
eukprot:6256585-Amphidinium_carterae.1